MNFASRPPTLEEIVEQILEDMSEADKANVVNTAEDDLISFHHGWGTGIRNHYNLHQRHALVKALGAEHPDDASMIIIKAVWQKLKDSGETYRKGKIETETLQWREVEQCLEINAEGRSLVIHGIDVEFAREIANALRMQLFASESYSAPEYAPRPILEKQNVTLQVWTYPKHRDNQ